MKGFFKILIVMVSLAIASPAGAGSLYLTGHDVLLHSGQNGYWRVILDYLRGVGGTTTPIPEANYDIAFLCVSCNTGSLSGYAGTITTYNPASMTAAQWADAFTRDVLVIPWSPSLNTAAKTALNAKTAEIEAFFNAGGDIWMNSSSGATDYYTILPPSVASSGNTISGSSGFVATAAGTTIGIASNMINGFATHNNFTSVGTGLTVYEEKTGVPISIGVQDASIVGGVITTGPTVPVPTLSEWALILLSLLMAGVAVLRIRRNSA